MNDQLELVEAAERPWRLDARTRAAGRRGVAEAREALRQASERQRATGSAGEADRAA